MMRRSMLLLALLFIPLAASAHLVGTPGYGAFHKLFAQADTVVVSKVTYLDADCDPVYVGFRSSIVGAPGTVCHTVLSVLRVYKGSATEGTAEVMTFDAGRDFDVYMHQGDVILTFLNRGETGLTFSGSSLSRMIFAKSPFPFDATSHSEGIERLNDDLLAGLMTAATRQRSAELLWLVGDNGHREEVAAEEASEPNFMVRLTLDALLIRTGDGQCAKCTEDVARLAGTKQVPGVQGYNALQALEAAPAGAYVEQVPLLTPIWPAAALAILKKVPVRDHLPELKVLLEGPAGWPQYESVLLVRQVAGDLGPKLTSDDFFRDEQERGRFVAACLRWIETP